ncbi:MAG: tRNA pseudouridine(13) synthase TruD [archaeon]|nr:MAG: tRNA pseudouridine(13) synthase TruD [archaeon]
MRGAPSADAAVGMEVYVTDGAPCTGRAKALDSDFRVQEYLSLEGLQSERGEGYVPLYRVEKRGIDTMHLAKELAAVLKSRVSYGGLKDKRAHAVQYITPTSSRALSPARASSEGWEATLEGFLPRPLSRGQVVANSFELILRDCCSEVGERANDALETSAGHRLPNFYGHQRFGLRGVGTHRVGREIVKGRFEEAVRLLLCEPRERDSSEAGEARQAFREGRYEEGVGLLPRGQEEEASVARALARRPGDWIGALRSVPVKLRRLYVQAYQSYLFNRTLSRALRSGLDISSYESGDNWSRLGEDGLTLSRVGGVRDPPEQGAVPMVQIPGFAIRDYGSRFDACLKEVLEEEGVTGGEFYVKEMLEASAEGGFRVPHLLVAGTSAESGPGTATLKFTLAKGQYATVFIREVLKPADPANAGLA